MFEDFQKRALRQPIANHQAKGYNVLQTSREKNLHRRSKKIDDLLQLAKADPDIKLLCQMYLDRHTGKSVDYKVLVVTAIHLQS